MKNSFIFIIILGAVFMLAPLAIDMYLPALPTIAKDLNTNINNVEATVAILLLGYALGQLILGPLSDQFGRSPILFLGLLTFAISSLLAGMVQSIEQLYLCRLFQAFGGAGSVVVFPLVRDLYDEQKSSQIISYIMALTVLAPLVAPIIGAYILTSLGWPSIFFALAVISLITLFIAKMALKIPSTHATQNFSVSSVFLTYLKVLRNWKITAHILTGSFAFAGLFAFVAGSPFVYITYFGIEPQNYGFLVELNAIGMISSNLINAKLLFKIDATLKMFVGAVLLAAVGGFLILVPVFSLGLAWLVAGVVLYVAALGFTATNAIVGALSQLPEENGTVSAVNGAAQFSIGAFFSLAISLITSTNETPLIIIMLICSVLALLTALSLYSTLFSSKRFRHA